VSFHTAAYHLTSGAAAQTNVDVPAVADPVLTQQQSHFIFTDDFRLGVALAASATLTEMRMNMPSMNAYARHQIWPIESSGVQPYVVTDLVQVADYRRNMIRLAQNEQMAFEGTNTAIVAEDFVVLVWLFTPDHQFTIPDGIQRLSIRANLTANINAAAYAWTGPGVLNFEQQLRGGWYSIVGINALVANLIALRMIFPRAKQYDGRVLRPATLAQNAVTRRPNSIFDGGMGVYGKFHSFEPPQVEVLATAAGNMNPDIRLDIVYHGEAEPTNY
jgi:hypothetical protein